MANKLIPYVISRSTTMNGLEINVNKYIDKGYIPIGGMVIVPANHNTTGLHDSLFTQSMVLKVYMIFIAHN